MSATNEYCFGVTTYSSPEATRNIINKSTLPLSAKLYQTLLQEKKKKKQKKTNQTGRTSLHWITPKCSYCYGSASTA
ncbi:uncharacterized protein RHIMIDRAFT_267941, partial [Rhizopus microsporus ATCC 52813]